MKKKRRSKDADIASGAKAARAFEDFLSKLLKVPKKEITPKADESKPS